VNRREALAAIARLAVGAFAASRTLTEAAQGGMGVGDTGPARFRCRPLISGPLWWFDARQSAEWGAEGWTEELRQESALGFDLLWLTNAPSGLDHPQDPLGVLLDLCARRKVQVILDTGFSPTWYTQLNGADELARCRRNIERLGDRFARHPAFYAWYVPHEIYMVWDEGTRYIDALYPALVERCKKAAPLPVTLSPFFILDRDKVFGGFRYNEPEEYRRFWERLIKRSGFDIIMLQDSGEHFSYVTNAQRKPFFAAMEAACRSAGAQLWGNVETAEFECPSIEEYVRRYGRVHHSTVANAPWRPVPIARLRGKLELAARHCERIVSWGYQQFGRPALGPAGQQWYEDYRDYAAHVRSKGAA